MMARPTLSGRALMAMLMFCHFIAAFAALGMPPFFALIVQQSLHLPVDWATGWLYVLPTLFTALSSAWWGRLADRYGQRRMLLRAQLGLAASFLLAGYSNNLWLFCLALVLQGLLGGTFAASNAYLSHLCQGRALVQGLNALQWSARAALLGGPLLVGWAMHDLASPITLYRHLALLPLLAFLLTLWLAPTSGPGPAATRLAAAVADTTADSAADWAANSAASPATGAAAAPRPTSGNRANGNRASEQAILPETTLDNIYLLNFVFAMALVLSFPYFVPLVLPHLPPHPAPALLAGLLFGLPHGVYLLLVWPLGRHLGQRRLLQTLGLAFAVLALCMLAHLLPDRLWLLTLARLVMGLALTCAYLALHGLMAGSVSGAEQGRAGQRFGSLDASGKWGGVLAGLLAGLAVAELGALAPFGLAALLLMLGAARAFGLHLDFMAGKGKPALPQPNHSSHSSHSNHSNHSNLSNPGEPS